MKVDGISDQEINDYFSGKLARSTGKPAVPSGPLSPMEERLQKFERLQKLLQDSSLISSFGSGGDSVLRVFEERLGKYEKLYKMMKDPPAVRRKMMAEGCTSTEIDKFFTYMVATDPPTTESSGTGGDEATTSIRDMIEAVPEGMERKPKIKPNVKLRNFFWTKLKSNRITGTIWHCLPDFSMSPLAIVTLESWFRAPTPTIKKKIEDGEDNPSKPVAVKLISVLDSKRTQIMLIVLGKIRRKPEEILQLIMELDPEVLTYELTCSLIDILPIEEEFVTVRAYSDPSLLDLASRMVFYFNKVPRLINRLDVYEIAFSWTGSSNSIGSKLGVLLRACDELSGSRSCMEKLMALILAVGNYLNGGTARGQAYGVEFNVLDKIPLMKTGNIKSNQSVGEIENGDDPLKPVAPLPGSNLLHFMVFVAEAEAPELLTFTQHWLFVESAASISLKQLAGDVAQLQHQLDKVKQEYATQLLLMESLSPKINETSSDTNLIETINNSEEKEKRIENITESSSDIVTSSASETIIKSVEREETPENQFAETLITRLQKFLGEADIRMTTVANQLKAANQVVETVMNLYGESLSRVNTEDSSSSSGGDGDACAGFFTMLTTFIKNFTTIGEQNAYLRMEKERKARIEAAQALEKIKKAAKIRDAKKLPDIVLAAVEQNHGLMQDSITENDKVGVIDTIFEDPDENEENNAVNEGVDVNQIATQSDAVIPAAQVANVQNTVPVVPSLQTEQIKIEEVHLHVIDPIEIIDTPRYSDIEAIRPSRPGQFIRRNTVMASRTLSEDRGPNLFQRFRTSQEASSDAVIGSYTLKLQHLANRSPNTRIDFNLDDD